ncbi:MAG: hypothetical protein K0Q91_132 [Fibrobacteria bacterium]|nr:hypothetical protein [Fibrobacteria bacterium]
MLFLAVLAPRAQDPITKLVFRGGLNFSGAEYDPDLPSGVSKSPRTGFHAGALLDIGANRRLHLLSGAEFDTRGYDLKNGFERTAFRASYLAVPFLFSIRPAPIFFLNAGGEAAFPLAAKVRFEDGTSRNLDNDLVNPHWGLRFEGGFLIPQKSLAIDLLLGAGYTRGMSQVFKSSGAFDQEVRHHVFRVFVGFFLGGLPL